MDLVEWLLQNPVYIIPLASFIIGSIMLFAARSSYQLRTKKLFKIITIYTLVDDYNDKERKLTGFGILLGVLGIVGLAIISSVFDK